MSLILCLLLGIDPLVSVGAAQRSKDAPVVVPSKGCEEGCRCNGTGEEPSGDGILVVNCRCEDDCECKAGKDAPSNSEPVCVDGSCGTPAKSAPVCVDGSCGKPVKSAPVARRGIFGWRRR